MSAVVVGGSGVDGDDGAADGFASFTIDARLPAGDGPTLRVEHTDDEIVMVEALTELGESRLRIAQARLGTAVAAEDLVSPAERDAWRARSLLLQARLRSPRG